jgi:hypothetical protein
MPGMIENARQHRERAAVARRQRYRGLDCVLLIAAFFEGKAIMWFRLVG